MDLPKEQPERGNDHLSDMGVNRSKNALDRHKGRAWRTIAQAYTQRATEIHVHFRLKVDGRGIAGDFCTAFYRTEDKDRSLPVPVATRNEVIDRKKTPRGQEQREVGKAVSVSAGELVEDPQPIQPVRVSTLVRLQLLDDCLSTWVDAPDIAFAFRDKLIALVKDGKHGSFLDSTGKWPSLMVGEGELEDQVIEGGAKVLQTVPDDKAKFGRRVFEGFEIDNLLADIVLDLDGNSIRVGFEPPSDFGFQALHVLERAI